MLCTRCMSATDVIESRETQKAGPGQRRAVKRAMGDLPSYVVRRRRCTSPECGQVVHSVEVVIPSPRTRASEP